MMKRTTCSVLAAAALASGTGGAYGARELTLGEALRTSEENAPSLKASRWQVRAAGEEVGVARAGYFPSLDFDAIDSWGFPGSSGYLGIGGLMGSPYRSGTAAGLVARDTLFDFGRTYAGVRAAEVLETLQRQGVDIARYAVDLDALRTFYECSRFRNQHEVWNALHDETEMVAKEVTRFVRTGQRSVVDRYLADAQVEEARTNRNYFQSRMTSTVDRLAMLMGSAEQGLSCPVLPAIKEGVPLHPTRAVNPYVERARTEVDLAKSRLFAARTDYLPRIVGVASVGGMERVRLVPRTDYSGGLGVQLPLFDGLGTVHRVGRAEAEVGATTERLGAVELQMRELDAKYDEVIAASKARLEHLEREQQLAREGFQVAKNRYFKYQGTLVDLRDALRNLGRIESEMSDTQADLLEAAGSQALLDGSSAEKPGGDSPEKK